MKFKDVVDNLNILKLDKMADYLSEYVDKVNSENIPFLDALYQLTKLEIANKVDEEDRTTIINFAKYKLVMFTMSKIMEMNEIEINKVALYLFNILLKNL